MSKSIVYVLTNEAMPNYVKIGMTDDVSLRMKTLDTTAVPLPFKCYYAASVENARKIEQLLLSVFADYRIRANREWLTVAPERIVAALNLHPHTDVTPKDDAFEDDDTRQAVENATRRAASNFSKLRIPVGAEIQFTRDASVTSVVADRNFVDFRGERLSVSAAALKALHDLGYEWSTVNGYQFWEYDGETLTERRARLESEENQDGESADTNAPSKKLRVSMTT